MAEARGSVILGRATADGKVFEDTKERGKPIVFRYGARPFTGGLCQGVEEALSTMRAGTETTTMLSEFSWPLSPNLKSSMISAPVPFHVVDVLLGGAVLLFLVLHLLHLRDLLRAT